MTALDRKLIRSLLHMWGQATAIALVIGCGVGVFVMSVSTHRALESAKSFYYDRTRFSEVFATLRQAPRTLESRIAEIPGVSQTETRIVRAVLLDIEGMIEPAIGRLISIPRSGQQKLNQIHLRKGRHLQHGRSGEVIVSEAFAVANQLEPGDAITAIMNGKQQQLLIVGVALSPEYITQMQAGSLFPDDRRFGVFWTSEDDLEAAFNMEAAFNDVTLTLTPSANVDEVIRRLDDLLDPYGGVGAYDRDRHLSHRFITDEISSLRTMAVVMPAVFFGVAAFLLNMALRRIIALEREQIAALKAFGYSNWEVGMYYFKLVAAIVVIGSCAGIAMGITMAKWMTGVYVEFYRLPNADFQLDPPVLFTALFFALAAAGLGVWTAVRGAVKLAPAEAMRAEPPSNYSSGIAGLLGRLHLISNVTRMIVREVERRPMKAGLSILGIAFAVAILIVGSFSEDAIDFLVEHQFGRVERQDVMVNFVEPTSGAVLNELRSLPGVVHAEPFRSVPCRLRFEHHHRLTSITGLKPDANLFRLIDADDQIVPIPRSGLVLSQQLGKLLNVSVGQQLQVEVLEGQRPKRLLTVSGFVNDYMGTAAYMNLGDVNQMMREGPAISGGYLLVDEMQADTLYQELKSTPRVAGVVIKTAALQNFMDSFAENLLKMKMANIFFACAIAIGVVYNNARISLSERSAELSTLRVIGFTRTEISAILLGELA
ncbi:MAG: FtsX-like permease family protein, partial [Verrucomicrobiota bacterium]